jgi:hypothetical protein
VDVRNDNLIVLDDVTSVRQRIAGIVVLLVIIAALAIPIGRNFDLESQGIETPTSHGQQTVLDMCGNWDVPDLFQPLANSVYPSWNWVCRLVQE